MHKSSEIFDTIKLENLTSHSTNGTNFEKAIDQEYQKRIDQSYDKLFEKLENTYEQTNRRDSRLLNILMDFAQEHDNIYFEIGVLLGTKLCKIKEHDYKKCLKDSIRNILKNGYAFNITDEDKKLLTELFLTQTSCTIETALAQDEDYQTIRNKARQKTKELDKLKLDKKEWLLIDEALCANNAREAEYGRVTYCQGFIDAIKLL